MFQFLIFVQLDTITIIKEIFIVTREHFIDIFGS